eukprot:2455778-Prymnesium_polylepis.1
MPAIESLDTLVAFLQKLGEKGQFEATPDLSDGSPARMALAESFVNLKEGSSKVEVSLTQIVEEIVPKMQEKAAEAAEAAEADLHEVRASCHQSSPAAYSNRGSLLVISVYLARGMR